MFAFLLMLIDSKRYYMHKNVGNISDVNFLRNESFLSTLCECESNTNIKLNYKYNITVQ